MQKGCGGGAHMFPGPGMHCLYLIALSVVCRRKGTGTVTSAVISAVGKSIISGQAAGNECGPLD